MRNFIYLLLVVMLYTAGSCSINLRSNLPKDYTDLQYRVCKSIKNNEKIDSLLSNGQLMMLQIGHVLPEDTIALYFNGRLIINNITTDYPFPYIDEEKYGGHGEHYYDFLLVSKSNNNHILLVNFGDPSKKKIAEISVKESLNISVVNNKGERKTQVIPRNIDHFLEIRFLLYKKGIYTDTLHCVHFFE